MRVPEGILSARLDALRKRERMCSHEARIACLAGVVSVALAGTDRVCAFGCHVLVALVTVTVATLSCLLLLPLANRRTARAIVENPVAYAMVEGFGPKPHWRWGRAERRIFRWGTAQSWGAMAIALPVMAVVSCAMLVAPASSASALRSASIQAGCSSVGWLLAAVELWSVFWWRRRGRPLVLVSTGLDSLHIMQTEGYRWTWRWGWIRSRRRTSGPPSPADRR